MIEHKMIEQRRTRRFPMILVAEHKQLPSESTMNGRTSDVSRGGCYIDSLHPFPAGTAIWLRLKRGSESFETTGIVKYANADLGMGVAFDDPVPSDQLQILDRWIAEAEREVTVELFG